MAKKQSLPKGTRRAVLARIMRYIRPHLPLLIASLALALIVVALTLYVPILVGRAIDCIVAPGQVDFTALRAVLIAVGVCIAATSAAQWLQSELNNRITYATVRDIRRDAFAHIQQLPLKYLDAHPSGDTVSRMISDVDTFADGLLMGFTQLFTGVMTIVGTLALMLSLSWQIALVVICITPVSLLVAKFYREEYLFHVPTPDQT